jgi:hypothetical protein
LIENPERFLAQTGIHKAKDDDSEAKGDAFHDYSELEDIAESSEHKEFDASSLPSSIATAASVSPVSMIIETSTVFFKEARDAEIEVKHYETLVRHIQSEGVESKSLIFDVKPNIVISYLLFQLSYSLLL